MATLGGDPSAVVGLQSETMGLLDIYDGIRPRIRNKCNRCDRLRTSHCRDGEL